MVRNYQWKRGDDSYLTKSIVEVDANENLGLWQSMEEMLKEHTHYKWRQLQKIHRITDSLTMDEISIHSSFSKNYKSLTKTINQKE